MSYFICDDALDRLSAKLKPVEDNIADPNLRPISFGFDDNDNPFLKFRSAAGITAYRAAMQELDPDTKLAIWLGSHPPTLEVHPRYGTAHPT